MTSVLPRVLTPASSKISVAECTVTVTRLGARMRALSFRWLDRLNVLHLALGLAVVLSLIGIVRAARRRPEFFNYNSCKKQCNKAKVKMQREGCMAQCNSARATANSVKGNSRNSGNSGSRNNSGNRNSGSRNNSGNSRNSGGGSKKTQTSNSGGGGGRGKRATYHYYDKRSLPNPEVGGVYCTDQLQGKWGSLKNQRGKWLAYCVNGRDPPCGKSVTITNTATGATEQGIVVDKCGFDGVDLALPLFNKLDTDGRGVDAGNMTVNVSG